MNFRHAAIASFAVLALSLTACAEDANSDDAPAETEDALNTDRARSGARFDAVVRDVRT